MRRRGSGREMMPARSLLLLSRSEVRGQRSEVRGQRKPNERRRGPRALLLAMTLRSLVSALMLANGVVACARGTSTTTASVPGPRRSAYVLTESEIVSAGLPSIYDVIQQLRPNMLRGRGPNEQITGASPAEAGTAGRTINVYLDGKWLGDPPRLQSVQSSTVKSVQFLNSTDAKSRFGSGHDGGAILVTSK